jgi:nicotinamidase-related amidase
MNGNKTALVTVDLQLSLGPGYPEPAREALRRYLRAFRAVERPIVHALGDPALCAASVGEAVHPTLVPRPAAPLYGQYLERGYLQRVGPAETLLGKPGRDAFAGGALEAHLRAEGVGTIMVAGIGFAQGIRATVIGAVQRRFAVVLLEDAVTEMYPLAKLEAARLGIAVRGNPPSRRGFPARRGLARLSSIPETETKPA